MARLWIVTLPLLSACSYAGSVLSTAGLVAGLVRAPVVLPTGTPDRPLTVRDRAALDRLTDAVWHSGTRYGPSPAANDLATTLLPLVYSREERRVVPPRDAFDDLADLRQDDRNTLVFVALSGGGARAAVLAAHAMRLLEKRYNELQPPETKLRAFAEAVDAYSSVSGGSLYAYNVALALLSQRALAAHELTTGKHIDTHLALECLPENHPARTGHEQTAVQATGDEAARWAACDTALWRRFQLAYQGIGTAIMYFSPFNFFYGPISTLFSDNSYLNYMAVAQQYTTGLRLWRKGVTRPPGWQWVYGALDPAQVTLGMIGDRPRFFFNATSLETGGPFVLTQRMVHLPSDQLDAVSARIDLQGMNDPRFARPLQHATTLEEINVSPSNFPLSDAAMASAAFPFGMEPMAIHSYQYSRSESRIYQTAQDFRLADGGVWDNSGMITLTDLYEHIVRQPKPPGVPPRSPNLVLISINAETEAYDPTHLLDGADERGVLDWAKAAAPIIPLRLGGIYPSINLIHYTNKRRAERIAVDKVMQLVRQRCKSPEDSRDEPQDGVVRRTCTGRIFYFPITLTQLAKADPYHINGHDALFARVQAIGTNYTLNSGDPAKLAEAAEVIETTPQGTCQGWFVGPTCKSGKGMTEVQRLDEAVALAVIRAEGNLWPTTKHDVDPLATAPEWQHLGRWCDTHPKTEDECPRSAAPITEIAVD